MTRDAATLVERVHHAGSIFLGNWSAVAAGDYASGGNHTLPTAGYARGFGPLAIEAFGRRCRCKIWTSAGYDACATPSWTLATAEGLPGHAASVRARFAGETARGEARRTITTRGVPESLCRATHS